MVVDCEKVAGLPKLTFYFGGQPFAIEGSDYTVDMKGTCISAFQGIDVKDKSGSPIWIIGTYRHLNFRELTEGRLLNFLMLSVSR